jgi:hypothetical protein
MLTHQPLKYHYYQSHLTGREVHVKSIISSFPPTLSPPFPFHLLRIYPPFLHKNPRRNLPCVRADTRTREAVATKLVAMGGPVVRKEPATTALLEHYPAAYQIFEQAGWLHYFRRLQGYNEPQVLQFARNLQEDHSVVAGVRISVTEQDIAAVSGLPMDGTRQFSRKHIIGDAQQNFFLHGEEIILKGRGVQLSSLPPPWPEVARFIKHYLTCEGRYQVVYQHDFLLLSHLRHNRRVNIPYFLLGCLKNMAHYCRRAKDPNQSLTHHRLGQLLINKGFEQQNHPPINPAPAAESP